MARVSSRGYNLQVLVLMAVYVALMFWLWPQVRATPGTGLKLVLSLSPVLPVALVVALMARRVIRSDELEQRLHLIALGVATALVGTGSLVGGFLAMAKIWITDGSVLFRVFPVLCVLYGVTQLVLKRRYTGSWDFKDC